MNAIISFNGIQDAFNKHNEIFNDIKVLCDESMRINANDKCVKEETLTSLKLIEHNIDGMIYNLEHDLPYDKDLEFMA